MKIKYLLPFYIFVSLQKNNQAKDMLVALSALFSFISILIMPSQKTKFISYLATFWACIGLSLGIWQFTELLQSSNAATFSFKWFEISSVTIEMVFKLDAMSIVFQLVVVLVVFAVHLYSLAYIKQKEKFYYASLNLFVFAMQALLIQDNWIAFFICWELMGLASFLLIDFDKSLLSNRASIKAFLLNRVGDVGLLIAISLLWQKSIYITDLKEAFTALSSLDQLFIAIGIALAVWIKTGQFPFSTWLADAMQAPTPISALLHAATMVAAGVYLLIRCESIFQQMQTLTILLMAGGILSSFLAAYSAYFVPKLKTQLAASTISQLGFMLIAVLMGAWQAALLHVFVHAFFKAILFLNAGYLIHYTHQAALQDIGKQIASRKTPVFVFHVLAMAALLGMPLSAGFLSKEWILSNSFQKSELIGFILLFISFFTAIYAGRQLKSLFFTKPSPISDVKSVFSNSILWFFPIGLLSLGSLWIVFSPTPFSIENSLFVTYFSDSSSSISKSSLVVWLPFIALLSTGLGFSLGFSQRLFVYLKNTKVNFESYFVWQDNFFTQLLWYPITNLAVLTAKKNPPVSTTTFAIGFVRVGNLLAIFDRQMDSLVDDFSKVVVVWAVFSAWVDKFVVDGILSFLTFVVNIAGQFLRSLQNGKVQFYISVVFLLLIGGILLILL